MTCTLLPARNRSPKPWKNGGGTTTDVCIWPPDAGLDDFVARVSIADVASSGPFSTFHGINRTTAILSGDGFDLTVAGLGHRLTRFTPPLAYPGDEATSAQLLGGPTTDLNAMTRQGHARHVMRSVVLLPGERVAATGTTLLLLTSAALIQTEQTTDAMEPMDAVVFDGADHVTVAGELPATAYRIDIVFGS